MNKINLAKSLFKALTASSSLLLAVVITGNTILEQNESTINGFLGDMSYITMEKEVEEGEEEDTIYWKTQYKSVKEQKAASEKLCEQVVSEGATLLKNNNALPLKKNAKVSLFSVSSVDLAIGGGGSGANSGADRVDLKTALESEGLIVNQGLWDWYSSNKGTYGRVSNNGVGVEYTIGDASWDKLPAAKTEKADVAIFVLTRLGSESVDIRYNSGDKNDMTNGNYLELSPSEISVLQALRENTGEGKTFNKMMVVMNTTNQVECDFIDKYDVDAVLWCGTLGSTGSIGISKIISGTVNPSGRLSDAFWNEHRFNPVYANWGEYYYDMGGGKTSITEIQYGNSGSSSPYVVYQEGIYNGYFYAETRYEDKVLGRANTDGNGYVYDYYQGIAYPFGYGLSYTSFEYSNFKFEGKDVEKDQYKFTIEVKNTGTVAGKEAVQLYLQKPYTEYDIEHGIEKSAVELVEFNKTEIIEPGKSEVVNLVVDGKYLASYDAYNEKTYVLEGGDYYFTVGRDSHDAINNIIKTKSAMAVTSYEGNTYEGNKDLVYKETINDFDAEKYSKAVTGSEITNKFDNADLKLYKSPYEEDAENDLKNQNAFKYMSRNDWNGTAQFGFDENMNQLDNQVRLYWTKHIDEQMTNSKYDASGKKHDNFPEESDVPYPTYGSTATQHSLIDLRVDENGNKIPFDDPKWQELLDQLTFEEQATLLECGVRMTKGISSINKPTTIDHNGGVGVNQAYNNNSGFNRGFAMTNNDPDKASRPCAYPSNAVVAATFNEKLIEEYGRAWGEDCLWAGYSGIYGPGINGHRGAYGGRTFEYYSEDAILGGKICAALCRGITSKGIYIYLKHAVLNDQENNRLYVATWVNEQTIRESYLRQIELAIVEGGAQCVMTGYNKIGAVWTAKHGFVNTVLHEEFGMKGFAVTDFVTGTSWKELKLSVLTGNGLVDRDFSAENPYGPVAPGKGKYGHVAQAMRLETHRILYTVVHSAAMNGISSNTYFIPLTPKWKDAMVAAKDISLTMVVSFSVMLSWCYAYDILNKKVFSRKSGGEE